jgi:hypothetical protein
VIVILFFNDIKAVFGIRRCFYLISVSEDALASFELRGLPVRDAFDSSFDGIVRVDYLSIDESRQLLERRIVGLPLAFICLCHSLSGGLARDLVRTARDMQLLRSGIQAVSVVAEMAKQLVSADLAAKRRATLRSIQRLDLPNRALVILKKLEEAGEAPESGALLKECRLLARVVMGSPEGQTAASRGLSKDEEIFRKLTLHLVGYLYYVATIQEFFASELSEDTLKRVADSDINLLARARQALAISPELSWSFTSGFRASYGLKIARFVRPRGSAKSTAGH